MQEIDILYWFLFLLGIVFQIETDYIIQYEMHYKTFSAITLFCIIAF